MDAPAFNSHNQWDMPGRVSRRLKQISEAGVHHRPVLLLVSSPLLDQEFENSGRGVGFARK